MKNRIEKISAENLIKAENTAAARDIHISKAIRPYLKFGGEIEVLDARKVIELVKKRPENSHKGSFGKLVLIAGSQRFPGAAEISALAALRSGAGLVTVITTERAANALAVNAKEATLFEASCDERGFISPTPEEREEIAEIILSASAVLVGPGLGTGKGCLETLKLAIKTAECPIILDADGLNLVCGRIEFLRKAKAEPILTPHPAELARLCAAETGEVLKNRPKFAAELSKASGCTVVAKSAGTVIASGGREYLSVRGNCGLSKGGSGDFLAGLIASFAAQGYSPADCAKLGATIQGLCCEEATKRLSRGGVLISDIIGELPMLFKKIERLI